MGRGRSGGKVNGFMKHGDEAWSLARLARKVIDLRTIVHVLKEDITLWKDRTEDSGDRRHHATNKYTVDGFLTVARRQDAAYAAIYTQPHSRRRRNNWTSWEGVMGITTNESRATCMLSRVATSGCGESLSYGTFAGVLEADMHIVIEPQPDLPFFAPSQPHSRSSQKNAMRSLRNRPFMHLRESDI
ncbi:hypothetical protein K491DRAFT_516676 [Lophiostoma macrostomum CBS 122681]|uniref:Uncharacterized protein n=1 Tax=Lophiostoma macrostomum CBS 122681 TaxID=1314788 RepID=A0A6A6T3I4_9PLEO|nr:hypothetical protein K491DRAFT_516676 [Lophiostoma macrostomum CBS 122681]